MNHATEEELLEAFYGAAEPAVRQHLETCTACSARLAELTDALRSLRDYPVPERGEGYGQQVWNGLVPRLKAAQPRARFQWPRVFLVAPAIAILLAFAFLAGVWTEHQRTGVSSKARERVLLLALSDHLERSQIVLTELVHAAPGSPELADDRGRARSLLEENRLLRQTAMHLGDKTHAALLDDLERVLLSLANSPGNTNTADLEMLQKRVEEDGLLWKVRITSANAREKGEKL